jgi:ubiquitin C-terminal hydrolase
MSQARRGGSLREIHWPRPLGLNNPGNDCYFNAALQCLVRIPLFANFVLSPEFTEQINRQNPAGSGGSVAIEFRAFLADLCTGAPGSVKDSGTLKAILCRPHPEFANCDQQDAHEILSALVDSLHEDLSRLHTAKDGLTPRSRNIHAENPTKPMSTIGDLMYGQFRTTLGCPNCGHQAVVYDPFLFLSIPVPENSPGAELLELVALFVRMDQLDKDNKWLCGECRTRVRAVRQTEIFEAPRILVFHLKRFATAGGTVRKVGTTVNYPDRFDVSKLLKRAPGEYKLLGVVMHSGAVSSGHYTAAAIDPWSGKWFIFNDSYVAPASLDSVHSPRAYMLFYQKVD